MLVQLLEVTGAWRKLHNMEFHDLYSSRSNLLLKWSNQRIKVGGA
jgi:hypothetical protein